MKEKSVKNLRKGVARVFAMVALTLVICMMPAMQAHAHGKGAPYVATLYNERNGLPTGEANAILQTSDGYIWIGSYGGLIRYDGTEFRNYSVERKIESSSIRALFEDSKGRLWIGTNDAGVVVMEDDIFGLDKLKVQRSKLPAITHVDYSARIQTVSKKDNERYWNIIKVAEKF